MGSCLGWRLLVLVVCLVGRPLTAAAGGPEFPAGGTRSLGRGAAGFARADDPSVMARNPALLADLWDDQAMFGAHLLVTDSCFQPTGGYGMHSQGGDDLIDLGEGPLLLQANEGDEQLDGTPLALYRDTPYPEVCFTGPAPILPQLGLSMKLADDLGVGLGFFPPDNAGLSQWGNRDGTVQTEDGLRPNPLRFFRSHLNVSFFTLLGAVGYRVNDWIRIGAGLQWNVAAFSATIWTTPQLPLNARNDVKVDIFGRDLFIPGFVASVDVKPIDALDVALGFRWLDRVSSNAKLDITTGAFGYGEVFEYRDADGNIRSVGSSIPTSSPNRAGKVDSPPIWVPQLALGVRYADRITPRTHDWKKAHAVGEGIVQDSMLSERWDIELDAVYYFNSVYDQTTFSAADARLELRSIDGMGNLSTVPSSAGKCQQRDEMNNCVGDRKTTTAYGGTDQLSVRLGGDYNVFPGLFALRAGVSVETDGQRVEMLNVMNYMLSRWGLHAGFTLRAFGKTDISFGFAHFIQPQVRLQVNETDQPFPRRYKDPDGPDYHFEPGLGVAGIDGVPDQGANGFDGIAGAQVPNADQTRTEPGPHYINAGTSYYNLDVLSMTVTQHF